MLAALGRDGHALGVNLTLDQDYADAGAESGALDEVFGNGVGDLESAYTEVVAELEEYGLDRAHAAVNAEARERGVAFGIGEASGRFRFDPVPRLIGSGEWRRLDAGLRQRAAALNRFVEDAYADRRCVAAGVIPDAVIDSCPHFDPRLRGIYEGLTDPITVAGFDLVRDTGGELRVLEDNCRTPSGLLYAGVAREIADAALSLEAPITGPDHAELLGGALEHLGEGAIVLTDPTADGTRWWEHHGLAAELGLPICTLDQLRIKAGKVVHRERDGSEHRIAAIYRRTGADRLYEPGGGLTEIGELLAGPLEQGEVLSANAFGTGVADDKLTHAYVEDLVRFYCGEEPLLRSVPGYDLGDPDERAEALGRLDELVLKPRDGFGGHGVLICARASASQLDAARDRVTAEPSRWIAQERVDISTHPTVIEGRLRPRHVDLRPFAITGRETSVVRGGLTRVALEAGDMVVNTSQSGGGKDTWIISQQNRMERGRP